MGMEKSLKYVSEKEPQTDTVQTSVRAQARFIEHSGDPGQALLI